MGISLVFAIDWQKIIVALQSDSLNDKSLGSLWIHQKAFLCLISYMKSNLVSKRYIYIYIYIGIYIYIYIGIYIYIFGISSRCCNNLP